MWTDAYCRAIGRRPGVVIVVLVVLFLAIGTTAPNLSRLAASRPTQLLPEDTESRLATRIINETWPDQAAVSKVVVALRRLEGLTDRDRDYARRLSRDFAGPDRPPAVLGVIGPGVRPEIDARLVSGDGRGQLVIVRLSDSFVGPVVADALDWLKSRAAQSPPPEGLSVEWSGDGVLGPAFMDGVRTTLDRAELATVALILIVLLLVYRSVWLALIPLITIGVSLVAARGLLGWIVLAGWDVSILLELFLIVILFGSGTDFCLLLTWRFAERWDGGDPSNAMAATMRRVWEPMLTSAGTVVVGMSLMGATRFALFSRTGPGVALGLAVTLAACLTLTPALLVALAQRRPGAFLGLKGRSSGVWPGVGRFVLARPFRVVGAVLLAMGIPAALGFQAPIVHDLLAVLPTGSPAVRDFHRLADGFGSGMVAPLTIVLESVDDLRRPDGLALIDELSRSLSAGGGFARVRSATQPTGDPALLDTGRVPGRLEEIQKGLGRISEGSKALNRGLNEKAAKVRLARGIGRLLKVGKTTTPDGSRRSTDPGDEMLKELNQAAAAAAELVEGSRQARQALAAILEAPENREALNRLLLSPDDLANPKLRYALSYYLSPDGRRARIELEPAAAFSASGIHAVEALRLRLVEELNARRSGGVRALVAGADADWADVRGATLADQRWIWWAVPASVALLLLVALRDPMASLNLVATMLLTYWFALGAAHLVFVRLLGAPGIDWTVPYFLFILLVAVGVDYNVFLMTRLREESRALGLREGTIRAIGCTGGLISSAAAITACSFAAFLFSPLASLRQLGFALVVGIAVDALLVRPVLVPCTHWILHRRRPNSHTNPKKLDEIGRSLIKIFLPSEARSFVALAFARIRRRQPGACVAPSASRRPRTPEPASWLAPKSTETCSLESLRCTTDSSRETP